MAARDDIFGYKRDPKPKNVYSNSGAIMKFGEGGGEDMIGNLIQNWNVNYNNNIVEIFELGSDAIYWAQGRPTGTGSIGRILGLGKVQLFPDEALNVCKGGALLEIESSPSLCNVDGAFAEKEEHGNGVILRMDGCIVTSIGFQAGVADTRINETIGWRFSSLELEETNAG